MRTSRGGCIWQPCIRPCSLGKRQRHKNLQWWMKKWKYQYTNTGDPGLGWRRFRFDGCLALRTGLLYHEIGWRNRYERINPSVGRSCLDWNIWKCLTYWLWIWLAWNYVHLTYQIVPNIGAFLINHLRINQYFKSDNRRRKQNTKWRKKIFLKRRDNCSQGTSFLLMYDTRPVFQPVLKLDEIFNNGQREL